MVLESMWDWRAMTSGAGYAEAPAFFYIDPDNHSGKRLHYLLEGKHFIVTNACRELVASPSHHGTPNPQWLGHNLSSIDFKGLLVCGNVAWRTYRDCGFTLRPSCRVVKMKHPAARTWTNVEVERWKKILAKMFA